MGRNFSKHPSGSLLFWHFMQKHKTNYLRLASYKYQGRGLRKNILEGQNLFGGKKGRAHVKRCKLSPRRHPPKARPPVHGA